MNATATATAAANQKVTAKAFRQAIRTLRAAASNLEPLEVAPGVWQQDFREIELRFAADLVERLADNLPNA